MSDLSGTQILQKTISGKGSTFAQEEKATAVREHTVGVGGDVYGPKSMGDIFQQPLFVCFDLCILDQESSGEPVTQLEPNKQYWVVVWADANFRPDRIAIPIRSYLSLLLTVLETDVAQYITIVNPQIDLAKVNAQDFEHQFELITDARLPHGKVTLTLQFWPENKMYRRDTAVSQQLGLAGLYDKELFNACNINPNMERPQHVAIIHVKYSEDNEQIKLTCWGHCADREISTMPFQPPKIRLAEFVEAQKDPWAVLGEIFSFSDDTANIQIIRKNVIDGPNSLTFLGWIDAVYNYFDEALQLAIVDHTDTEIPWEMLKLGEGRYLGALIPVVRWLSLPTGIGHRNLEITPNRCVGKVAAYLDEASLPDAVREKELLTSFDTQFYDDVEALEDNLRHLQPGTGLVYLGCHGMFMPHDIDAIAYGSQNNPGKNLIPLHLEIKLAGLEFTHRPIFFINACHSGRIIRREDRWRYHGLPIVLLKHIADSYVGTLGPVGSTYANQIGRYILNTIGNSAKGESIAELLRQLRTAAAERLNANLDSEPNQLLFIYTFMYIYYGNPLLKLRLHPAPEPKGGDDV